jgi:hypothetical protein
MNVVKFPSDKPHVTDADPDDARRAKAYFDMEPHLCDVVSMGKIASQLLDHPDRGLYDFAVIHLSEMLAELKARYSYCVINVDDDRYFVPSVCNTDIVARF